MSEVRLLVRDRRVHLVASIVCYLYSFVSLIMYDDLFVFLSLTFALWWHFIFYKQFLCAHILATVAFLRRPRLKVRGFSLTMIFLG